MSAITLGTYIGNAFADGCPCSSPYDVAPPSGQTANCCSCGINSSGYTTCDLQTQDCGHSYKGTVVIEGQTYHKYGYAGCTNKC
jgi:hypothetical protein